MLLSYFSLLLVFFEVVELAHGGDKPTVGPLLLVNSAA